MLTAPIDKIRSKLTKAGFLKDKKPIPKLIWTPFNKEVIFFLYQSWYISIMEYYAMVRNRHQLASYLYKILNSSCAKLLASKFSLSSQKKVEKKDRQKMNWTGTNGMLLFFFLSFWRSPLHPKHGRVWVWDGRGVSLNCVCEGNVGV